METSKRTIYRDIATWMVQRAPITGEPGIGYVLKRGFDMPALMLNTEEIEAAVLGANWVATRGEPELALAARNLIAKTHAVVPERLRPTILAPSTSVAPVRQAAEKVSAAELRSAIRSGFKIQIAYRREDGRSTAQALNDAVAAVRAALEVYTRAQFPAQWAATQNNLAIALSIRGLKFNKRTDLINALAAVVGALDAYSQGGNVYRLSQARQLKERIQTALNAMDSPR